MFKLDDKVILTRHRGLEIYAQGTVVEVVKPGEMPNKEKFPKLFYRCQFSWPRLHESYVVESVGPRGGKKHYWPRVSSMKLVSK